MKIRSTKVIAEAIYEATRDKSGSDLTHTITHAVEFMNKNQLLGKSKEILTHLEKIIDADEKIVRAKVTSADVLSKKMVEELEENLKKRYKAKKIEVDTDVDEELIHGVKIEVHDEIIDLTLRNRLHKLQTYLIKN